MSDPTPALFTPATTSLRASMAKAIAEELGKADPNTLTARVEFRQGDDWKATVAWRMDRHRWALDLGVFTEDTPDPAPIDLGAFAEVKVRF